MCPEPAISAWRLGPNTYVLRQSLCTSFEGPFMYMLFGDDYVLLEDTGDGGIPITTAVSDIIDEWLAERGQESIELIVANSHAHGDHVQGNAALSTLPYATLVGTSISDVSSFFAISDWPNDVGSVDLGGRVLDIIPIPGHQAAHIAIYDPEEQLILTGDTLYPGRLYISDFAAYQASIDRLVDYLSTRDVCWVMGTHVEMTQTAGVDFQFGADQHPDEHPLQLTLDHLLELQSGVSAMNTPSYEVHDDFIIYPL
jgi:glyoxylase-like metal-dependent hydrolase (beta-lactamase superfamily II)